MKKSFALIICMLLGLAVLAGCGGQTAQPSKARQLRRAVLLCSKKS